ncbi:ORF6N domain-containing protein [Lactobacillus sp. ESL0225]|uniref:ORF6N domain-containing protein n=1 Tax=Lactobacillus sp. ESL0225 TaxID=2069351 RepID=UPI000EFD2390|nr:ORF6N domain-containing protein [Lactobacillus sp. ESL0225]RMC50858.1 hypothetical protein F5ESL0225_04525 [Lactobacillus sp. ESL0225]
MNDLKVIGKEHIGKIEFTGIEGGFGKNKKAMLVKDIAKIHDSTTKRINELINRNIGRFKNNIDVIDLLTSNKFKVVLNDLKFSAKTISNSKNVYLLSERGYAKLLKILDDDKAWDIYDELVDNYFNMRKTIKNDVSMFDELSPDLQMFKKIFDNAAEQQLAIKKVDHKLDNITEIVSLSTTGWRKTAQSLIHKMAKTEGGFGAYQQIQSDIYKETDERAGSSLKTRLTNKRKTMALNGASKSAIEKVNRLDVLADDKRLLQIYMGVVKDFAIKYKVWEKEY